MKPNKSLSKVFVMPVGCNKSLLKKKIIFNKFCRVKI